MQRRSRNLLLVALAVAAVAGIGGAGWWILREPPKPAPVVELGPRVDPPAPSAPESSGASERAPLELAEDDTPKYESLATTVVFPLEVHLDLVRAAARVQADGAPALGSGATAKFGGSVVDGRSAGVRAQVKFVAGPNRGRTLYADSLGRFGAENLYPGLSIVSVTGPGIPGAQREVRLRPLRETALNLSYARPARVYAEVVDKEAKPVVGAVVTMDGQTATSDEEGVVEFAAVAAGEALVVVEKPGFASVSQTVNLVGGTTLERGQLKFRLDPGASLQVSITDALNAQQEALLFLLPDGGQERAYPWQNVNPIRIWPGGTKVIEDLPTTRVSLRLYHAGATGKPPKRSIELQGGRRETIEFGLVPAPVVTGVVLDEGTPAENALVRLEAPDRSAATLSVFGEASYMFLESGVLPDLPPAMQEARTNERGEYQLSASEDVSAVRYLTALSRDGKRTAHAVLNRGDQRADFVLKPVSGGGGELAIQTNDRIQPLPVEITVEGEPRDPFDLPVGRDLRVADLPEGSWRVTVRWNDAVITRDQPLEIVGETRLYVALPEGAIVGQDEDTRRRAGKN